MISWIHDLRLQIELVLLLTAHQGDAAALNWIIPGFLGCAPEEGTVEGELLASAKESDVVGLYKLNSVGPIA
jgi:nucleolar protein 9